MSGRVSAGFKRSSAAAASGASTLGRALRRRSLGFRRRPEYSQPTPLLRAAGHGQDRAALPVTAENQRMRIKARFGGGQGGDLADEFAPPPPPRVRRHADPPPPIDVRETQGPPAVTRQV